MSRLARVVVPHYPHHVVQRGNRRQRVFFNDQDKLLYLRILRQQADLFSLKIWAYCLMDNHVHLLVVPEKENSLAKGIGETHRIYTTLINRREEWKGYLWQGRFYSCIVGENFLLSTVRYIELNPVRAGIVSKAWEYGWSSARAHVFNTSDATLAPHSFPTEMGFWTKYLLLKEEEDFLKNIRRHVRTGRPWGSQEFVQGLERVVGRELLCKSRGRRPKIEGN
jgi:putative transposase